jgi:hypothetical protein
MSIAASSPTRCVKAVLRAITARANMPQAHVISGWENRVSLTLSTAGR